MNLIHIIIIIIIIILIIALLRRALTHRTTGGDISSLMFGPDPYSDYNLLTQLIPAIIMYNCDIDEAATALYENAPAEVGDKLKSLVNSIKSNTLDNEHKYMVCIILANMNNELFYSMKKKATNESLKAILKYIHEQVRPRPTYTLFNLLYATLYNTYYFSSLSTVGCKCHEAILEANLILYYKYNGYMRINKALACGGSHYVFRIINSVKPEMAILRVHSSELYNTWFSNSSSSDAINARMVISDGDKHEVYKTFDSQYIVKPWLSSADFPHLRSRGIARIEVCWSIGPEYKDLFNYVIARKKDGSWSLKSKESMEFIIKYISSTNEMRKYLHDKGYGYFDWKIPNIMIKDDGNLVLADIDCCKLDYKHHAYGHTHLLPMQLNDYDISIDPKLLCKIDNYIFLKEICTVLYWFKYNFAEKRSDIEDNIIIPTYIKSVTTKTLEVIADESKLDEYVTIEYPSLAIVNGRQVTVWTDFWDDERFDMLIEQLIDLLKSKVVLINFYKNLVPAVDTAEPKPNDTSNTVEPVPMKKGPN